MSPPQPRPANRGEAMTDRERLEVLQALVRRMRRAGEKLPTLGARNEASANADVVQWAHDQLKSHLQAEGSPQ